MDVEAFVDDRRVGRKQRLRAVGKRQHFEIAADDEVGLGDAGKLRAERQRGPGDRDEALGELAVPGRAELDRRRSLELATTFLARRKPASVTLAPPARSIITRRRTAGSNRSCTR